MEKIIIYNDQLHDLIVTGQISETNAYDLLEKKLTEGHPVSFFTSVLDVQPIREFYNTDEFKIWRKKKEEKSKRLADLFSPKH